MNRVLKRLLLGLVIWVIPFVVSVFVWDVEAGGPLVSAGWFSAMMAFSGAVGFAIAAVLYFGKVRGDSGLVTGLTWYVELVLLDLIVLVGLFGMTFGEYSHLLVAYLNVLILAVVVGKVRG